MSQPTTPDPDEVPPVLETPEPTPEPPPTDDGWTLIALVPHDGKEPPPSISDDLARSAWCTVSAIWHPSLLARARVLPRIESLESPSPPGPHEARVIAGGLDRLPSGYRTQAEDAGAALIEAATDRDELVRRLQERLGVTGAADLAETSGMTDSALDFMAMGTVRWMLRDLAVGMGHADGVDRETLWRELSAGAHAWQLGDAQAAANRLRAGFELLTQSRERFYPVDAYLLDLCLLDPSMPAGVLAEPLATPVPVTFVATARAIEVQAEVDPDRVGALRQAITDGWADVAGGTYTEAEDALLPLESILWQFWRGGLAYHAHLDERGVETYARRRFGLFTQLPQIAKRNGIRYALHMSFDTGRFPLRPETKRLWEGPEGSSLESLMRPPLAADRPSHGWRFAWRLAATMRDDHIAALPVVRWPSPVAPWFADLRRVAAYSPVLGRWTTLNDFFHLTDRPYEMFRPDTDAYATPYLAQAVARRDTEPVSWLPRHRRLRARLDAARMYEALARAIESAAGGDSASPREMPALTKIEDDVELRRPEEAERELDRAEPGWASRLAGLIVGTRSAEVRRGYLVINPLGVPRRAAVFLPDAAADLRPEGPLRAAQLTDEGVYAVVDLPPFGFAWVPAETDWQRPAAATKGLSARDRELRNESIAIEVDAATGGLRSIAKVEEPSPRLAQQLVIQGLVGPDGKPAASQMRRGQFAVDYGGPALVQATATGRIVEPGGGTTIAAFEQRYRLWTGRPILEVRITLGEIDSAWLEQAARSSDPWSSYLACRWAWPDSNSMLRRMVLCSPELTELDRPETPDALDITTRTQRTALLFGGLSYHQKAGGRMLDTLLLAGAETARSFTVGVALDLEYPFHAAQDFVTPPAVVAVDGGPPALGVAGWLARIDHQNVAISRVEFTENAGDRGWGLIIHLLETAGQSGRCRLRLFRNPTWARQVDFLGETIVDLSVDGDAVQVDLTPNELARVEVTLS